MKNTPNRNKWYLRFVAGNPEIRHKVRTHIGSPMKRSDALDGANKLAQLYPEWRVWIEDENRTRIYESDAEKKSQATEQQTKEV